MNPLRSLSRRERRLVVSWTMLENWGKTPVELGLSSWDDVDPWWGEAMLEISAGYAAGQKKH
jgi:hypothetical protein